MILNGVLRPHVEAPGQSEALIRAAVEIGGDSYVVVSFTATGFADRLRVPEPSEPAAILPDQELPTFAEAGEPSAGAAMKMENLGARTDGLWRSTCFEVFASLRDGSYAEFNISPSGEWAAYRFSSYRDGMVNLDGPIRVTRFKRSGGDLELEAVISWTGWPGVDRIGLSAVIEDIDGGIAYWALTHPSAKPDFHHPASFVLDLP